MHSTCCVIGLAENIFTDDICYICIKQLRLSSLENKAVNDMFVILSDVWVDNSEVLIFGISSLFYVTFV